MTCAMAALPHPSQGKAIEEVVGLLLWPRKTVVVEDRHVIYPRLLLGTGEQTSRPNLGRTGGLKEEKSGVEVV